MTLAVNSCIGRRGLLIAGAAAVGIGSLAFVKTSSRRNADVVVIGGGAAGLAAAVSAAESGASVILLEKQAELGGNTRISGGFFAAVDPSRQRRQHIDDSKELFLKQILESGGGRSSPILAKKLVDGAGEAIVWLEGLGMRFQDDVIEIYGAHWPRCHKPVMPAGEGYIYTLSAAAGKLGVDIRTGAKAERLEHDPAGGWIVAVRTKDGFESIRSRRAVVLASGGFGANRSMIKTFAPQLSGLTTDNTPGSTGEMLLEAKRHGGCLVDMNFIQCLPGCPPGRSHRVVLHSDVSRFIFVDKRGKRFVREDERRDVLRDAVLALPEGYAYCIVDNDGLKSYNVVMQKNTVIGVETGDAWRGNTIEDLARAMGLPEKALRETVDRYNASVSNGRDEFGKSPTELTHPLVKPPFWACFAGMTIHYTMGGIRINEKAEVITAQNQPISGLYAAGESTGGVHGINRMGANGINDAIVFGRMAGQEAAKCGLA